MHRSRSDALTGFWIGGFEGADHVNAQGLALDMAAASGHARCIERDHALAATAGLRVVRESIGWRLCEPLPRRHDFDRALRVQRSARRHGLQVLWTLMHYGLPGDLSLHDDALIDRFAAFAAAAVAALSEEEARGGPARPPVITPINEIGFLAWCAAQPGMLAPPNGAPGGSADSATVTGYAVKRRLVRATLAAIAAIRALRPDALFMHTEPLMHVVAPPDRPELAAQAEVVTSWQWQSWDLLVGRCEPELGGRPDCMDLVGANHYHSSQWELVSERRLRWHEQDPRRRPLQALLAQAWQRYRRPLVLAETSHVGVGRAAWLHDVAGQVRRARRLGVPVQGLCLYPLVDRPDWNDPGRWHRSGLWHVPADDPTARIADVEYLAALQAWQVDGPRAEAPVLLVLAASRWSAERPGRTQQLACRLAGRWRVVWVEPLRVDAERAPAALRHDAGPCVEVVVTRAPPGVRLALDALRHALPGGAPPTVVWAEHPSDGASARALAPGAALVCEGAGPVCTEADLVLCRDAPDAPPARDASAPRGDGGAARVLVLPDGSDLRAFAARSAQGWDAEEAGLLQPPGSAPRIGYAGPVDARIDFALLRRAARARPDWQWLLCGPLEAADAAALPDEPNLRWIGDPPRRIVPALMAGWQVAMLPRRDATPRATAGLDALASGLPVVALGDPGAETAPWPLAVDADAFVAACAAALAGSAADAQRRGRIARELLAGRDWSDLADRLHAALVSLPRGPVPPASR